jgi:ribosomal protein S18 acetylase RimI-like enzyme
MSSAAFEVRELGPSDWSVLRDVRLRALSDSPGAFLSTYEREAALEADEWTKRLDDAAWLVATDGGEAIGLVGLVEGSPPPGARYIESTWVAPAYRRRGVFRSLLARLVEIGRGKGLDSLFLWVVGNNDVARRAYASLGFVETNHVQHLDGDNRSEHRLRLDMRR